MRVTDYSVGVMELMSEGMHIDTALLNLMRMLKARGHERLYPKILTLLLRECEKGERSGTVTLVLAQSEDAPLFKEAIERALGALNAPEYTTRIDPTITGGFIIEGGETRIDQSYKRRLLTLYRSLINHV